ncbi:hypothetical protein PDL71_01665 [Lacibacter sp. MH-610]|uniref:DUF4870 domain-containing protein n=1 Tax=Lacibacter sp. MH-610 TaxID=3020883 RepID=UPI0038929889
MDAKTISWVSYITIIGWIIAFVQYGNTNPKSSLATFHLRQSFGIIVTGFALYVGLAVLGIAVPFMFRIFSLVWIVMLVLWILGLIAALNGEEKPVPVLGPMYQQWFQFIK